MNCFPLLGIGPARGPARRSGVAAFLTSACAIPLLALAATEPSAHNTRAPAGTALTSLADLERAEPELAARSISIDGVVLCFDRDWEQLYVHDGKTTAYLPRPWFPSQAIAGDRVKLTGVGQFRAGRLEVVGPRIEKIGTQPLPAAKAISLAQLASTAGEWVTISGQVGVAESTLGRLILVVEEEGLICVVQVMGVPQESDLARLPGTRIQVRGINTSRAEGNRVTRPALMVSDRGEIRVLGAAANDHRQDRVISVESLLNRQLGPWTNKPVRLSGVVASYKPGSHLIVQDPTGSMRAQVAQETSIQNSERVEVWGRVTITPEEIALTDAWFAPMRGRTAESQNRPPPPLSNQGPGKRLQRPLTTVQQVRECPNNASGSEFPVRLRGILTYVDRYWQGAFLQDGSAAVYLMLGRAEAAAGDFVEITGITREGHFAPIVEVRELHTLDRANFPAPIKADISDLTEGQFDARWVQVEGVLRSVQEDSGHARLLLSSTDGPFKVTIPNVGRAAVTNLINVLVSVRGACGSDLNPKGQVTGVTLHVPGVDFITPLEPVPSDPFQVDLMQISSVATFVPGHTISRRVRVQGVVTTVLPDGGFYLQDNTGGIRVHLENEASPEQGRRVEVVGFPAAGDPSPFLEESILRGDNSEGLIAPIRTTAEEIIFTGTNDAMLVELDATVLQYTPKSVRGRFILQDGDVVFNAPLMRRLPDGSLPEIRNGSKIRVRGICRNLAGGTQAAESFRLLIFDPASVQVLKGVPWWTARHSAKLLGGVSLLSLILLGWTGMLRQQVRRQTQVIRRELKVRNAVAESLSYERDLLNTLMEHSPDAIYFKDLESRFVRVSNSTMENLYRVALERHSQAHGGNGADCLPPHLASVEEFEKYVVGKSDADFYDEAPASATREQEQQIIKTGRPLVGHIDYRILPGGNASWRLVTKMPWRDKHGRIIGTFGMSKDITSIKDAEARCESTHRELLATSRQAGMAEVATSVLHNVGNVLNSVNVSASLISSRIKDSKATRLSNVADLLREHRDNLGDFLSSDPKGRLIPDYLLQLSRFLTEEQQSLIEELRSLSANIDHIKEIVTMQQSYARVAGVAEQVRPAELVEDALRMNSGALARHEVRVDREYQPELPEITVEKHKVLQVLVNLIRNAKYACDESGRHDKRITLRIHNGDGRVKIAVADNGVGIPAEHMTRIFSLGFTTRPNGHGFGLHSGALAARELGGSLHAASDGPGKGAVFTLELPVQRKEGR